MNQGAVQPIDESVTTREADPVDKAVPDRSVILPKGHKILISVEGQIGSKISKRKDFFPIKLVQPVIYEGKMLLPAGIMGEGQVVHAKKGGFAGSAGELVLAARYLEHDGQKVALRSFKFLTEDDDYPHVGQDNTDVAMAVTVFAAPLGYLIGGGNTVIEPGTLATAKIREDIRIKPVDGELADHSDNDSMLQDNHNKGKSDE